MPFQNMQGTGLRPKGSSAGGFLEGILTGVDTFIPAYQQSQDRKAKREKDKIDMYVALRKAGYSNEQATETVNTGRFSSLKGSSGVDQYAIEQKKSLLDLESKSLDVEKKKTEKERGWQTDYTKEQADKRRLQKEAALTAIETGKYHDSIMGAQDLENDRGSYEAYIAKALPWVSLKDPEVKAALDRRFSAKPGVPKKESEKKENTNVFSRFMSGILGKAKEKEGKQPGSVLSKQDTKQRALPDNIKTTTQAVDFMMKEWGMTRDQAIAWIKENS